MNCHPETSNGDSAVPIGTGSGAGSGTLTDSTSFSNNCSSPRPALSSIRRCHTWPERRAIVILDRESISSSTKPTTGMWKRSARTSPPTLSCNPAGTLKCNTPSPGLRYLYAPSVSVCCPEEMSTGAEGVGLGVAVAVAVGAGLVVAVAAGLAVASGSPPPVHPAVVASSSSAAIEANKSRVLRASMTVPPLKNTREAPPRFRNLPATAPIANLHPAFTPRPPRRNASRRPCMQRRRAVPWPETRSRS